MPILAVCHVTRYRYARPATLGPQVLRLIPRPSARVLSHALDVAPARHAMTRERDAHGNRVARVTFPEPATELRIEARLVADLAARDPEPAAPSEGMEAVPCLVAEAPGPRLRAFLDAVPHGWRSALDLVEGLAARVAAEVGHVLRPEPGVQPPEDTLARGTGSCRDSAWLLVAALRQVGLPARFVSGYLLQPGPGGTDGVDLHAWAEALVPGAGWVGLDPTSGGLAGPGHVPLAAAPHHADAAPLAGTASHGEVELTFRMEVERLACP